MLDFPLFLAVIHVYYYSLMKDKLMKVFISLSCLNTMIQFADTNRLNK